MALVGAVAQGQAVHQLIPELPFDVAAIIHRHAPIASLVNDFYVKLHNERRSASFPRDEIEAALRRLQLSRA